MIKVKNQEVKKVSNKEKQCCHKTSLYLSEQCMRGKKRTFFTCSIDRLKTLICLSMSEYMNVGGVPRD